MSSINEIQTNLWEQRLTKLQKKNDVEGLKKYKLVINATTSADQSLRDEYIQKCDDIIAEIEAKAEAEIEAELAEEVAAIMDEEASEIETEINEEDSELEEEIDEEEEEVEIDAENVTVGEDTKHFKVDKKVVAALVGLGILTAIGIGVNSCGKEEKLPITTETEADNDTEKETETEVSFDQTLAFNPEDTKVMISNTSNFFADSLGKGVYLNKDALSNELESFIDFNMALNIDEIGPGYLASLYQNDNKSYVDVFNGYTHWAMRLTDTAMLSTKDTVINIESMVANKEEGAMLQQAFNLLAEIHDNGLAGDKEALTNNANALKALLTKVLVDETDLYSPASKVMLAYAAQNADTLLINYKDIKVLDDDMRKVMYEDASIGCAFAIKDANEKGESLNHDDLVLLLNNSEKSQSAVSLATQLKDKYNLSAIIINTTDKDYSNETSVKEAISELESSIDLSLYKETQSLEEYNDITHEINYPTIKVPENSVIVDNGDGYVSKEEMDKHNAKNEEEYKESVKDKTEQEFEEDKTVTDSEGNKTTGEEADKAEQEAYSKAAYMTGYSDGLQNKPYNPTSGYENSYNEGYADGQLDLLESQKNNSGVVKEETEMLDKPIIESTEVVETETQVETEEPETEVETEEPETEEIIYEEVIEEGVLPYALSEEQMRQYYFDLLMGMGANENSAPQKVKTR